MSFFAVLFALVLEQLQPLPRGARLHQWARGWVEFVGRNLDAGQPRHARIVWAVAVLVPPAAAALAYLIVRDFSVLLALALDVAVLYLTLGFRQFSHRFTAIRDALDRGDEAQARALLADWRHLDTTELPRTELLRHVIEQSLLAAHRNVFGVFFWFVMLSALGLGPAGAVLYRMAEFVARHGALRQPGLDAPVNARLADLVGQMFRLIDHLPARLTAAGFAVVGNFEEAVAGWRRDAGLWRHRNEGIILAAAAGAVGVQLGGGNPPGAGAEAVRADGDDAASGSTPGVPPQLQHLQSLVGLVWRSVVLWMLLVALLTLANIVG
jgi:adenosylcobinamide-phosphate synthase